MNNDIDTNVKLTLYRMIADTGSAPTSAEIAKALNLSEEDIRAAFARLHTKRLLVPEPNDPSRIRMAPPFSGIATAFPVEALGKRYYANCVWDAFGVAAALDADAIVPASDGYSGEPLTLEVKGGSRSRDRTSHTSRFPQRIGGTTSFTPERPCFSSGRKKRLISGANRAAFRAGRSSVFSNYGNWPWSGMPIASRLSREDRRPMRWSEFSLRSV